MIIASKLVGEVLLQFLGPLVIIMECEALQFAKLNIFVKVPPATPAIGWCLSTVNIRSRSHRFWIEKLILTISISIRHILINYEGLVHIFTVEGNLRIQNFYNHMIERPNQVKTISDQSHNTQDIDRVLWRYNGLNQSIFTPIILNQLPQLMIANRWLLLLLTQLLWIDMVDKN